MIPVILLVLAQPAPPPVPVVWSSDGGSVSARVGSNILAVVSGTSSGPQTKTCSANEFLSTLAAGTSSTCSQPAFSGVSGSVSLAQNGTGAGAPATDDQVLLSASTSATGWAAVPDCDGATKALNYRTASNTFACNTFSTSSGYATVMDEGSALTQRATVNFVGAVTCVDNSGASRTDCTVSGGSSNVTEVTVAFGAGATTASTVVTGQAWVTATSKILCVPVLLAASGRNEGAEDPLIEGLTGAAHTRVLGTGFTLTAGKTSPGLYYGSQIFHCTGS